MNDKVLPTSTNSTETPAESAPQASQQEVLTNQQGPIERQNFLFEFDDAYGYWMPTRTANTRHQTNDTACGDADRCEGKSEG